jgi:hypothetical protein
VGFSLNNAYFGKVPDHLYQASSPLETLLGRLACCKMSVANCPSAVYLCKVTMCPARGAGPSFYWIPVRRVSWDFGVGSQRGKQKKELRVTLVGPSLPWLRETWPGRLAGFFFGFQIILSRNLSDYHPLVERARQLASGFQPPGDLTGKIGRLRNVPCQLSRHSVSVLGYDGSCQRGLSIFL